MDEALRRDGARVERVAAAIPDDRRIESVAQVFHVALEGGARDGQCLEKHLQRHDAALMQQLVDAVNASLPPRPGYA